ncbi:FMN-binding negative transcriptional regulator [Mumia sp. zg.B17]|uniref:FMN-binding negative transcriptional regulator n=1 Tax=unclassified Mumia TaxID=2621872 RepID=UPI001C6EE6D2|nr:MULTISPECIES: FMN-binding negative transcriptional regulator [unclassified Mumia]MBW9207052.1 FMN-binding negative transcriptional regulator [Mumia sp. zg.B17]MBW9210612.1 FMN-binding negative transcriptional regulator [Mumia sp. zg.B21]MDD9349400.1 FMN-binding negative transcriptional regulator [Mumia sp.]
MYVPRFNSLDDAAAIDGLIAAVGAGDLVTVGADGMPYATRLPLVWLREEGRVIAHVALANPHWRTIGDGSPALVVVSGPQAYVSPSWYATKAQHGRVVPTWNYSRVELRGTVRVRRETEWIRDAVTRLTDLHERSRPDPWAVTDAPAPFVDGQLRGIVGVEVAVTSVEGKAKLSQNRSAEDRDGVVHGLRREGDAEAHAVAGTMDQSSSTSSHETASTR